MNKTRRYYKVKSAVVQVYISIYNIDITCMYNISISVSIPIYYTI